MIRGIFKNWRQVVFYDFDCSITKHILENIIKSLKNIKFVVVAVVSDLGPKNSSLRNNLGISETKPYFNVNENEKIFVFADIPHLIKLIRNHFLDSGFIFNGKIINSDAVKEILTLQNSDIKICCKITDDHIFAKGPARQKVKLATQLFSHSVSKAIRRCISLGKINSQNSLECSDMIKLVNDWFDIFNSRIPSKDSRDRLKAFGLALQEQTKIINSMTNTMKNLRVIGHKTLLPFQVGIISSNSSLVNLFEHLQTTYNINYILTNRLNQDVLEHFFGVIRSKCGLYDHPTPLEFTYRLRSCILGRSDSDQQLSDYTNVEKTDEDFENQLLTKNILHEISNSIPYEVLENSESLAEDDDNCEIPAINSDEIVEDGLEYFAGFIIKKCGVKAGECCSTYTWVDEVSEGGLVKPSIEFLNLIKKLENIFQNLNENSIFTGGKFLKKHLEQSENILLPDKVKSLFFRSRLHFRIKFLNKKNKNNNSVKDNVKKKKKINKTIA